MIAGHIDLGGEPLRTGDAAKVTGASDMRVATDYGAELIFIDVPLRLDRVDVSAGEW